MAEAKRENIEHMNHQIDVYPRDLLRRFGGGSCPGEAPLAVKEEFIEEVELSLGLSLGGSFGADPNKTGIVRSSSAAAFSFLPRKEEEEEEDEEAGKGTLMGTATAQLLMRTCSLPVETCEEHRKRKEMQSLRRLENKRKREEKRGLRPKAEEIVGVDKERGIGNIPRPASLESMDAGVSSSSPSPSVVRRRRQDNYNYNRGPATISGRLASQQSCGAQGGCSTSSSEYDCRSMQGLDISGLNSGNTETKSPSSINTCIGHTDKKIPLVRSVSLIENPTYEENNVDLSKKAVIGGNGAREVGRPMMEDMPHVSTRGDGPNGKRVEGVLYKYTKGEEMLKMRSTMTTSKSTLFYSHMEAHGGCLIFISSSFRSIIEVSALFLMNDNEEYFVALVLVSILSLRRRVPLVCLFIYFTTTEMIKVCHLAGNATIMMLYTVI